ncbi:MAG: HIT family protein [Anaerolineae bacterium]
MGTDCVFCRILAGAEPASVIYRDDATLAFMDISQLTRGHALVIPSRHVENVYGLTDEEAAALMTTGARIARALKQALQPAGINFWMANERAAGQDVMHAHLHVIPRYPGDGFGVRHEPRQRHARADLDSLANLVQGRLAG